MFYNIKYKAGIQRSDFWTN